MKALDELREGLLEAARRDVEVHSVRKRRQRRRTVGVLVALLLGGAAAATAADLIAVGEPAPDILKPDERYRPAAQAQVVLRAENPDGGLPYGVAMFKSKDGQLCVLGGAVRGNRLGLVEDGKFRPFTDNRIAACRDPARSNATELQVGPHWLVFGRTAPGIREIRVLDGAPQKPGPGGAYLFVMSGERPERGWRVTFR